jgi:hypothetical protein
MNYNSTFPVRHKAPDPGAVVGVQVRGLVPTLVFASPQLSSYWAMRLTVSSTSSLVSSARRYCIRKASSPLSS